MREILEPLVTNSQALKVTMDYVTIGSMKKEAIEFAKRINTLADEADFPEKGSGRLVHAAKVFKVSTKGARKWFEGEGMPQTTRINEIASFFGVNSEWLLSGRGEKKPNKNHEKWGVSNPIASYPTQENRLKKIPLVPETEISKWKEFIENIDIALNGKWIETSANISNLSFAFRANGDSMLNPYGSPSIPNGSIVIIDTQANPADGKIILAKLPGQNSAILKKLVIDGPNKYLKALNPEYKTISIDENCTIIGVAKRIEIDL